MFIPKFCKICNKKLIIEYYLYSIYCYCDSSVNEKHPRDEYYDVELSKYIIAETIMFNGVYWSLVVNSSKNEITTTIHENRTEGILGKDPLFYFYNIDYLKKYKILL